MADNVTYAYFANGKNTVVTSNLWQYDYGQILVISGVTLPQAFEVQFCNRGDGTTISQVGGNNAVYIPDQFLQNPEWIDAYIYLHTGEEDGETVYKISIPVRERPEPSDITPTPVQQDVITETIAALNEAVDAVPGMIDDALAEAKASGEFDGADGADGNGIWWTNAVVDSVPSSNKRLTSISYLVGRAETIPAVDDLVYAPPADTGGGTPTFLYRITEIQGGTAVMVGIGSMKGTNGTNGVGVPAGGTTSQVLAKASGSNYDTEWVDQSGATIFDFVYDENLGDGSFAIFPTLDEVLAAGPDAIARLSLYGEDYETYLHAISNEGTFIGLVNNEIATTIYPNGNAWVLAEQFIGGGGTSDYSDLSNKPQINSVTLSGNKSLSDLGIQPNDFIVTITYDSGNDSYSADKTFAQIKTAKQAGKNVVLQYGNDPTEFYRVAVWVSDPLEFAVFSFNQGTAINQIMIDETDLVLRTVGSAGTYSKPSGGIPASDLASGVIPTVPSASDATPQALGTAAAGSSTDYSRADHVHAKPTYSKSDVGLGNVDNVQQYSSSNPPPYPVTSVNGSTGAVSLSIPSTAADVGAAPAVTEVTNTSTGDVTLALDPGKIYHFTGAISSLTLTLTAAGAGQLAQYHFDFNCGSTAPTVTLPSTVVLPDGNSFDANKHYEVDILNGYAVVMAW